MRPVASGTRSGFNVRVGARTCCEGKIDLPCNVLLLEVAAVVEVLLLDAQIRPDEPSNIPSLFAVEVSHAPQSVCAKEEAPWNIFCMLITLATSHLEMSPLNDDAVENISPMSVTLETSHLERS